MACTIDHLAPGQTVRVLVAFTDLDGVAVPADARGVIEELGMDWQTRRIFVAWVRDGQHEKLWFSGRKTEGVPSNGSLRDFFEVEPAKPVAPLPVAGVAAAAPVARKPARLDKPLAAGPNRPPPGGTDLKESPVACECDPRVHRPLLGAFREVTGYACLRCGTVTFSKAMGDDGRYTGEAWTVYRTVAIPEKAFAWAAQWPRVAKVTTLPDMSLWFMAGGLLREAPYYLPAGTRCDTAEALEALESRLRDEQASLTHGQRLRRAGVPRESPPSGLTHGLEMLASLWKALQLRPDSPLDELIAQAHLDSPGSEVAAETLHQRPDSAEILQSCLCSDDRLQRSAGFALALQQPVGDPGLATVVLDLLENLTLGPDKDGSGRITGWSRFEALLVLVGKLKLASPGMLAALPRLQRKLAREDLELAKSIGIVLGQLRGVPHRSGGPFLP